MPRSIIPHGNRPRVPAGFGRQSSADGHRPAHAGAALKAGDGSISSGNHNNTASLNHRTPSGATPSRSNIPALNASQHVSSRQTGDGASRRASGQFPATLAPPLTSTTGKTDILRSSSPSQAMAPSGLPPHLSGGRNRPPTGHSLLGQAYNPPSKEKFATVPAVTVARSNEGKVGPQGKGTGSTMAQSRFATPAAGPSPKVKATQDYGESKSLLGQTYQAPSTEKFAKMPAVKLVRPDTAKPIIEKPDIQKPVIQKPIVEKPIIEKPIIQKPVIQKPVMQKPVMQKPNIQKPVIEKPDVQNPVVQKPVILTDIQVPTIQKPNASVAKRGLHDYAVKPALQDYAVKPVAKVDDKENSASSSKKLDNHGTPQRRTEQKEVIVITKEDIERFTDATGRRVCLASIPPGTRQSDVRDMIVGMTNAKISNENVAVYEFPGKLRPNYALVETESEKEAGRIASWVDRERLFGWPISARVVRNMTQEQVNTVLNGETLDSAGPAASVPEPNTSSWAMTTPLPFLSAPCRYWAQGYCRNGTNCTYSHSGASGISANLNHYNQGPGLRPAPSMQSLQSIHSVTPEPIMDGEDLVGTRNYRGRVREDR